MKKVTIRKEKIFGKTAYVILKSGKPTEFRFTRQGALNFAKKLRGEKRRWKRVK